MKLTAYHKHVLMVCDFDREAIADLLLAHCMQQNPMTFELIEETGDAEITNLTFFKVADILINEAVIEKFELILSQ